MLPEKFKLINKLTKVEHRSKLSRLVVDIYRLIQLQTTNTVDPKLSEVTERFLDYLAQSCQSAEALTMRAAWLVTYGEVVEHRWRNQQIYRLTPTVFPSGSFMVADDFVKLVNELSAQVVRYRLHHGWSDTARQSDDLVLCELNKIVASQDEVIPDLTNFGYQSLTKNICYFLDDLVIATSTSALHDDWEAVLLTRLKGINYAIMRHTLRYRMEDA